MSEEESLNLVWFGAFERVSFVDFVPFRQAGIEDTVDYDLGRRLVIRMDA